MTEKIKVQKRNYEFVEYDGSKIKLAIAKAMSDSADEVDMTIIDEIEEVIASMVYSEDEKVWTVEDVSDEIENMLMDFGLHKIAKEFILYRAERNKERDKKWEMTDLQYDIWHQKYEFDNEGFNGWIDRVSNKDSDLAKLIRQKKFLFGGRILSNRGLHEYGVKSTYSNCYVLAPPEDNIESIFDVASKLARTFSYGGGVGINIGKLRPNKAKVNNSAKTTSGAVSFMDLYSLVTGLIGQNSRRGALMLNIPCSHPDIEEFIDIKNNLDKVTKANISIDITDDFMEAVINKQPYTLSFTVESTGEVIEKVIDADKLFTKLAKNNWMMAEPGALFKTNIDSYHLMSEDEDFEYAGVNPCAEEPLPEFGSCLLGSINLSEFVINPFTEHAEFNYNKFKEAVQISVKGLNDVLDEGLPLHPLKEQREVVRDLRQIGLGIFGLADMLVKLNLKYGSQESLDLCDRIGFVMADSAIEKSALMAKEYGMFPKCKIDKIMESEYFNLNTTDSTKELVEQYGLRNSQLLTSAPTGSISTMIGISGGIEPFYQISYTRRTESLNEGEESFYKVFTPIAKVYMDKFNLSDESQLPDTFVTAMTLDWMDRIKMQSVWQKHIDASISSTINLHENVGVDEVKEIYIQAWKHKLKGITIYRDNCARQGILINDTTKPKSEFQHNDLTAEQLRILLDAQINKELSENPNVCPLCKGTMIKTGGCSECLDCGYSPCAI